MLAGSSARVAIPSWRAGQCARACALVCNVPSGLAAQVQDHADKCIVHAHTLDVLVALSRTRNRTACECAIAWHAVITSALVVALDCRGIGGWRARATAPDPSTCARVCGVCGAAGRRVDVGSTAEPARVCGARSVAIVCVCVEAETMGAGGGEGGMMISCN